MEGRSAAEIAMTIFIPRDAVITDLTLSVSYLTLHPLAMSSLRRNLSRRGSRIRAYKEAS